MPLPLLAILGIAAAGEIGTGKTIKAAVDQKDAKDTNESAQRRVDRAKEKAEKFREESGASITSLGTTKVYVMDHSIGTFLEAFSKLKNVTLSESDGLDEIANFKVDKQFFKELRDMNDMASSIVGGVAGGAAAGAITAIGAYSAVMSFGAASTGAAIAGLSGAAATNATLAFLGGGSLAAGGLGIAGGTAVLGGLVAGPALAIMGFVLGAKASANRDQAYSNLSKAIEFKEEMETVCVLCNGIRMRSSMFERILLKLNCIFERLTDQLVKNIEQYGCNYAAYGLEQRQTVSKCLSIVKAIKSILDTPILTEDGKLTTESAQLIAPMEETCEQYADCL